MNWPVADVFVVRTKTAPYPGHLGPTLPRAPLTTHDNTAMKRPSSTRCIWRELVPAWGSLLVVCAVTLKAQSIPGAVLAKNEPHHHLVYEDASIRVLRVRVPAHDTTLLHEHDPDYFWVALGNSTVINARIGSPDATIASKDLSIHYSVGPFAHVARNPSDVPFDNITVELLEPQKNVRNLCEESLAGKPVDCSTTSGAASEFFTGGTEHTAFATDRLRVSMVALAPGAALRPTTRARGAWVIALDTADVSSLATVGAGKWRGGTFRAVAGKPWSVSNRSRTALRVVTVVEVSPQDRSSRQ